MDYNFIDTPYEPALKWQSGGVAGWVAAGRTCGYRVIPIPKPVDRWVADIDGKRELVKTPDASGETLYFWYREDAQKHCHEREYGRTGFLQSQSQTERCRG